MKDIEKLLWGLVLIIIGVILGTNALGITNINLFFNGWWTLFIIVPCTISLFNNHDKTGNIIGITIGLLLFLSCRDILDFDIIWKLLFPIILVIAGGSLIFKNITGKSLNDEIKELNKDNKSKKEYSSTFSSRNVKVDDEFKGTDVNAIFGGVTLDLRNAKVKKDQVINACAIFGGIDIFVPENVNVKVNSTSVFGGVDQKKHVNGEEKERTIYINATCIFGGVDIK